MTAVAEPATAADPIAVVEHVHKEYGVGANRLTALYDVSLAIRPGRSVALVGRSGSGKSTLLNLLGAVDRPTAGSIRVGGTDLSTMPDDALALFRRRRLGYVFQSFHLVPSLTVFDNVAVPWTLDRSLTAARRAEIADLLERLGVADKAKGHAETAVGGAKDTVRDAVDKA